jgi:hypothetical protein
MSQKTREHVDAFWSMVDEILNAVLFLLLGLQVFTVPMGYREVLASVLVVPKLLLPVALTLSGWSASLSLPDDSTLCGALVDLQMIESDGAAAGGWSMTAGLELVVGEAP